ncbi:ThiF family adenylyltransferase [Nocardiopsis sp. ARC36]
MTDVRARDELRGRAPGPVGHGLPEAVPGRVCRETEEDFYPEFTRRNRGLVTEAAQEALYGARVLVAGCGSTGGAAIEPLTRLGVRRFVLVEPGSYELNNLNRQDARYTDIGRNKAEVGAERVLAVNPYAEAEAVTQSVTSANAETLVAGCSLVVDGVDVTTPGGWEGKVALHRAAALARVPVVSGYDMSGTQHVRVYDYRSGGAPLGGAVTPADLAAGRTVWTLLHRVIPSRVIPPELVEDVMSGMTRPGYSVPQLVYTSTLFGALAACLAVHLLEGRSVRGSLTVDLHGVVRPAVRNWASLPRRIRGRRAWQRFVRGQTQGTAGVRRR